MAKVTATQAEVLVTSNPSAMPHGVKGQAVRDLMQRTGASKATVYRMLHAVTVRQPRKPRADKGQCCLPLEEARLVSAWLMDGLRKSNKRLRSLEQCLQELRYAGLVRCEYVEPSTGEVVALSVSAVARGLKLYGLHPDQLLRPAPSVAMQSLHPNHVWEIDASLCVLYYLGHAAGRASQGLQVMDHAVFYKNKPANVERIAAERVWRYLCVDHYSGSVFCNYVMGAESGHNLAESFMQAVTPRQVLGQVDPFSGVPFIVYMDPGSANTGAVMKNLCRRLQVRVLVHEAGNARATGGVEKAHDIWEHNFEASLRSEPVADLADLNEAARVFSRWFNATQIHTRHGRTRTDMWLSISAEHKRVAPPLELLRLLATHHPEERRVEAWPGPVVKFQGKVYDVSAVPNVMIGEKLPVTFSPYEQGHACIVTLDATGNEALTLVPEVAFNEAGFPVSANVFGEDIRSLPDTVLQTNKKMVERLAMGAATDEEAAQARKERKVALGGLVQPLRQAREAVLPTALPKRGTALDVQANTSGMVPVLAPLSVPEAVRLIKTRLGDAAPADLYAQTKAAHPDGKVPQAWAEAFAAAPAAQDASQQATGTHGGAVVLPWRAAL